MDEPQPPVTPPAPRRFEREGPGLEFGRLVNFTDAIFAIAMTLLVVEVGIPVVRDDTSVHDLARALEDKLPGLIAFVIGFLVIGFYWVAHHRFMARIAAADGPFVALTVVLPALHRRSCRSPPGSWASTSRTRSPWQCSR